MQREDYKDGTNHYMISKNKIRSSSISAGKSCEDSDKDPRAELNKTFEQALSQNSAHSLKEEGKSDDGASQVSSSEDDIYDMMEKR